MNEMGEEIESFILQKLDDAIIEASKFHIPSIYLLPKLEKEFKDLRELIKNKRNKIKHSKESTITPPQLPDSTATTAIASAPTSTETSPPPPADGGKKGSDAATAPPPASADGAPPPPASADGGKKESEAAPAPPTGPPPASDDGGKKESDAAATAPPPPPVNEEDLLREQLYYVNNVLTEWQMISNKPFSYSDSYTSIKHISNSLNKIKQDLMKPDPIDSKKIKQDLKPDSTDSEEEVIEYRWSTRLVNLEKVHGFEDKILSLERLLVLQNTHPFKAFGIHGMAGVGKTTLCQSIFNRPKVMEHFFPRIWVCLSKQKGQDTDNRKEVVKRMLRCLGIDVKIINMVEEKQRIRGLLFALRLQLTGKKYFIVLDDAYDADDWFKMFDAENDNEKFGYGLPKECGGTVLVTSRVEQVVKNMVGNVENLRCILPLTDQETCWKIFKDTVEEDGTEFPSDLNKLKAEIVKRCDGLPLAAKLLGQIKHQELLHQRPAIQPAK